MSLKTGVLDDITTEILRLRKTPDTRVRMQLVEKLLIAQLEALLRIEELLGSDDSPDSLNFYLLVDGQRMNVMGQEFSASSQIDIVVKEIVNKKGRPAKIDGDLKFSLSKGSELGELKPSGMMASFIPVGDEGDVEGEISADVDLGAGIKEKMLAQFSFKLLPLEASAAKIEILSVEMQEPAPQPEPIPAPQPEPAPAPVEQPAPAPVEEQPAPAPVEPGPVEEVNN